MITQSQAKVLKLIIDYIGENSIDLTSNELGKIGISDSSQDIQSYLDSLEKLGCISRLSSGSNSITVTEDGKKLIKLFK